MAPKNNLRSHMNWLKSSGANVATLSKLTDITNIDRVLAPSKNDNNTNRTNEDLPNANITPSHSSTTHDLSTLMNNVGGSGRTSGLRVVRRENSKSSPLPIFQQPTVPSNPPAHTPGVRSATKSAVIDLTFDDEPLPVIATPSNSKRKQSTVTSLTRKKQRTVSPSGIVNNQDDLNESDLTALDNYDFDKATNDNQSNSTSLVPNNTASNNNNILNTSISSTIQEVSRDLPIERRLLRLQRSYINACETRISLLVKRVAIEESEELSEKDKRMKRFELNKEISQIELKQDTLKQQLLRLEQQASTIGETTVPTVLTQRSATIQETIFNSTTKSDLSEPKIAVNACSIQVLGSSKQTQIHNQTETSFDRNDRNDLIEATPSKRLSSFRDIPRDVQVSEPAKQLPVRSRKQTAQYSVNSDEEPDDEEEGQHTMDGLVTSDPDEDHDTDLDGFIVDQGASDEDEDFRYESFHDASEAPLGDEDDEQMVDLRVSQSEVENLKNLSDVEENVDIENDDRLNVIDEASSDEEEIQNGTYRGPGIRSENTQLFEDDFDDDSDGDLDDDIVEAKFDEEREVDTQAVEIVDLDDSDLEDVSPQLQELQKYKELGPTHENVVSDIEELPSSPNIQDDDLDDILEKLPLPTGERHPWTSEVYGKLREVFKLPSFRQNQVEAINATLSGRDVFVLMPTGGGKSLCYQLPAIIKSGKTRGTTIVVSPLISLMQDQVEHLWEKNIPAGMISSKSPMEERKNTFHLFVTGQLKLIYLSPEMIGASTQAQNALNKLYKDGNLARIVIDEAHCVSSWGHDFRPDYTSLGFFKQKFPDIPIIALTATANDHVRMDIVHCLNLNNPLELKQSFNRTNLYYEVLPKDKNHSKHLEESIRGRFKNQTGIIYCHSKKSCEQTADKLSAQGITTAFYHAGMIPEDRLSVQKKWQSGEIKVICATIAFGMGIDKPDVRFVFHLTLPRTLEGYYQETGRAGRDGKYSHCIMYYTFRDAKNIQTMISKDKELDKAGKEKHLNKLIQVMQYCENNTDCRRKQVLQYFNEEFDKNDCHKNCDNCRRGITSELIEKDVTDYAKKLTNLVKCIQDDKVTLIHCQDVFKGLKYGKIQTLGHHQNEYHGSGKDLEKRDIERIAFHLVTEKVLEEYSVMNGAGFSTSYVRVGRNAQLLLSNRKKIIMSFASNTKSSSKAANTANTSTTPTSRNGTRVLSRGELDQYRLESTPRIVSAKTHYERTSSNQTGDSREGSKKFAPKPIQLGEIQFATDEERINFAKTMVELKSQRNKAMANIGYMSSSAVMSDVSLRHLASLLPTTEEEFKKIPGLTSDQKGLFKIFKSTLISLKKKQSASHSASEKTSPYFSHEEQESGRAIISQLKASQSASASQSKGRKTTTEKGRSYGDSGNTKRKGSQSKGRFKKKTAPRKQTAMPF